MSLLAHKLRLRLKKLERDKGKISLRDLENELSKIRLTKSDLPFILDELEKTKIGKKKNKQAFELFSL